MKTLFTLLGFTFALTALGNEPTKLGPIAGQAAGVVCPTINGHFVRKEEPAADVGSATSLDLFTTVENGRFSYATNGSTAPQLADGRPRRVADAKSSGEILITCNTTAILFKVKEDRKETGTIAIIALSENRILVKADGAAKAFAGEYAKVVIEELP